MTRIRTDSVYYIPLYETFEEDELVVLAKWWLTYMLNATHPVEYLAGMAVERSYYCLQELCHRWETQETSNILPEDYFVIRTAMEWLEDLDPESQNTQVLANHIKGAEQLIANGLYFVTPEEQHNSLLHMVLAGKIMCRSSSRNWVNGLPSA